MNRSKSPSKPKPASRKARPASRRSEPVLGTRPSTRAVAAPARPRTLLAAPVAAPAAAAPPPETLRPQVLRTGPRFPDGDYDYTYLHDFMALDYVPRNCRAVIFGCGKGEESVFLSERGYRVTGLDSNRNSIGLARERAWLNSRDVDFMIGEIFESATLLPAESFGLASDRGFFRSIDPVKGERERRRFLDLVRRLLLPGGVFLINATQVAVGRMAKATRRRKKVQNDLLVYEGGEVMGEIIRAGLEIVGRRQYPVVTPPPEETGRPGRGGSREKAPPPAPRPDARTRSGDAGLADLLLYCRKA